MKTGQLVPYQLPTVIWSENGSASQTLRDVPIQVGGRTAHIAAIQWELDLDISYTTAPTIQGFNAAISNLIIRDGRNVLFQGNLNTLRAIEAYENGGRVINPDPDTNGGTGNNAYVGRTWFPGPPLFAGAPNDFMIPVSVLESAEISYTFPALTAISADATAGTVAINTTVWLYLTDKELRVPPVVERNVYPMGTAVDVPLTGRALYPYLFMLNSAGVDAFAAADIGDITIDTGTSQPISAIAAEVLGRAYNAQMRQGQFGIVAGEPRAATDDNLSVKNSGTPTALVAATAAIQPVLWCPEDSMISRIIVQAESVLRLRQSGAGTGHIVVATRLLEQPEAVVAERVGRALSRLRMNAEKAGSRIKTLSKATYNGPRKDFMPVGIKLG